MQGNTLAELLGHTAIIYAVAVLPAQNLVASGTAVRHIVCMVLRMQA